MSLAAARQNIVKREYRVLDIKTAEAKADVAISFSWYSGCLLAITKNAVPPWLCVTTKIFSCSVCSVMWSLLVDPTFRFLTNCMNGSIIVKIQWFDLWRQILTNSYTWTPKILRRKWSDSSASVRICGRAHCLAVRCIAGLLTYSLKFEMIDQLFCPFLSKSAKFIWKRK